jgi:hypothetical protein
VSRSYREVFYRALAKVLAHKRWRIIRIRTSTRRTRAPRLSEQDNELVRGCPL